MIGEKESRWGLNYLHQMPHPLKVTDVLVNVPPSRQKVSETNPTTRTVKGLLSGVAEERGKDAIE